VEDYFETFVSYLIVNSGLQKLYSNQPLGNRFRLYQDHFSPHKKKIV